jgi:iron complex outermembrane receptor protein
MLSPYVQGTLHISPGLDLVGGARVNYEEKAGQFIR